MTDRVLGAALAVSAVAAIVWASTLPLTVNRHGEAVLRLAWSVRPERIETCREARPDELARVPQHMRQTRICEGVTAEYRLVVASEDGVQVDRMIRGGGLRRDRRLYVFEELRVPAGAVAFDVTFERATQAADVDVALVEDGRQRAIPAVLSLGVRVTAEPGEVVLVTYDPERRELVVVRRLPGLSARRTTTTPDLPAFAASTREARLRRGPPEPSAEAERSGLRAR